MGDPNFHGVRSRLAELRGFALRYFCCSRIHDHETAPGGGKYFFLSFFCMSKSAKFEGNKDMLGGNSTIGYLVIYVGGLLYVSLL